MASQPIPYPIRMPDELRDALAERARVGGRSLHAEIIAILQDAASRPSTVAVDQNMEALAELIASKVAARLQQVP